MSSSNSSSSLALDLLELVLSSDSVPPAESLDDLELLLAELDPDTVSLPEECDAEDEEWLPPFDDELSEWMNGANEDDDDDDDALGDDDSLMIRS